MKSIPPAKAVKLLGNETFGPGFKSINRSAAVNEPRNPPDQVAAAFLCITNPPGIVYDLWGNVGGVWTPMARLVPQGNGTVIDLTTGR